MSKIKKNCYKSPYCFAIHIEKVLILERSGMKKRKKEKKCIKKWEKREKINEGGAMSSYQNKRTNVSVYRHINFQSGFFPYSLPSRYVYTHIFFFLSCIHVVSLSLVLLYYFFPLIFRFAPQQFMILAYTKKYRPATKKKHQRARENGENCYVAKMNIYNNVGDRQ